MNLAYKTKIRNKAIGSSSFLPISRRTDGQFGILNILPLTVQSKLTLGAVDDPYEREADHVAEAITRMPDSIASLNQDSSHSLQRKAVNKITLDGTPPSVQETLRSPGQPLDERTRAYMEPRFGHDFGKVKIHTDSKAAESAHSVNAMAYVVGNRVIFGGGEYQPDISNGRKLIAHELTHIVQNNGQILHRKIKLANTVAPINAATYTSTDVNLFYNAITGNHPNLEGLIAGTGKIYKGIGGKSLVATKKYRETLVKDILSGLLSASMQFEYRDFKEVYDEVYKRAVASLYMRTTQGTSTVQRVRYPGAVGRKTNRKASVYWTISMDPSGHYKFNLTADGRDNAYEALRSILFDGTSSADTTRMHCDYVISAIHYMTMAEDMGTATFDQAVKDGNIKVFLLVDKTFRALLPESITVWAATGTTPVAVDLSKQSLGNYYVSGESELIVGDHVVFYNHSAYNSLNKRQGESWKLENAFIIDKKGSGGSFRFQGHGYYSPKERSSFIIAMKGKFNTLFNRAKALISAGKTTQLASKFPFVKLKSGVTSSTSTNDYEVVYHKSGKDETGWTGWGSIPAADCIFMTLRSVTDADYPNPFACWGEKKETSSPRTAQIPVWRPAEGLKD